MTINEQISWLKKFSWHFAKDPEDRKDLVQETLYHILKHSKDFELHKGHLMLAIRHTQIKLHKKKMAKKRKGYSVPIIDFDIPEEVPAEEFDYGILSKVISKVKYSDLLVMQAEGCTQQQIADYLKIDRKTVYLRALEARRNCRKLINQYIYDENRFRVRV